MRQLIILFIIKLLYLHTQAFSYQEINPYIWEINFDGNLFSNENCEAILISPDSFLAEAECVKRGFNVTDGRITVNYRHIQGVYTEVATVNKTNIHFSTDIQNIMNIIISKVALLTTDQPVVSLNYSLLSTTALVLTFNDPCWYKEANLVIETALSDPDSINFSRCFVPVFNNTDIDVSPCEVSDDKIFCSYNQKISNKKLRLKNFVYCEKKHKEEKKYVIGMLLEETLAFLNEFSDSNTIEEFSVESLIESGYIYF